VLLLLLLLLLLCDQLTMELRLTTQHISGLQARTMPQCPRKLVTPMPPTSGSWR
jgi:hypothetical protein